MTPSRLASKIYNKTIKFDKSTDKVLSTPYHHKNKKDDLCNNNKCVNNELSSIGFGKLPRHMMPQFSDLKSIKKLVSKINKIIPAKGEFTMIPIRNLAPTQSEIRNSRAQDILNSWGKHNILSKVKKGTPILTSKTGSVIDGHHRSEALKKAVKAGYVKDTDKVQVYAINLPAWTILSMANKFGYNKKSQPF
jgi:hypothetical protein